MGTQITELSNLQILLIVQSFQVVAVHSLHQSLQLSGAAVAVVLSDNVVQGAVGHRQSAVVDRNGNFLIQIQGIDIANLYIVQTVLFHRRIGVFSHLEGVGGDIAADCEVETDCSLGLEDQGHTVQADACQVVFHSDLGNLCGNCCAGFDLIAGVGKRIGVVSKIGLGCCTVVQHFLHHFLDLVVILAGKDRFGILTNRIAAAMDFSFAVEHSQADGIGHLCSRNIDSYYIAAVLCCCGVFSCVACNSGVDSVACSFLCQVEVNADVFTQRQAPACKDFRFAFGEYGCRQHCQDHCQCQQRAKDSIFGFLHNLDRFLSYFL